jgi:hypothetical protein
MEDRPARPVVRVWAIPALVAVGVSLLVPLPAGWLGAWQDKLLSFGHVPLFAALVLALRSWLGQPLGRALLAAVVLAGVVEVAQAGVGRSADWADFLRGCLGAAAGAAAVRAYQSRTAPARAAGYLSAVAALLAWPVAEVAPYAADAVEGRRAFPVLADFATRRQLLRWECDQAAITPADGGGLIRLLPGPADYPSAALRPVVSDFGAYRWLCCELRVDDAPLDLVISVRTGGTGHAGTTHAQLPRRYGAGRHVVRVDLWSLAGRGRPSPLDLSDVRAVQFFVVRPDRVRSVVLSGIWLES